ncbi:MAG: carbohydrate kinase family protein [Erysipelotrichaceae bacterium]|nr:carbohydrate kinase family protein [Erysipelotrichaceae bacterium]
MKKIYVIGGANIDIFALSKKEIVLRDSNPARIELSFGGVARNIAENLCHLEERPVFVSAFANDAFGKVLFEDCQRLGMDLKYSEVIEGASSSMYLANLNYDRDMYLAMNDMSIVSAIDKSTIDKLNAVINDDDYVIADTNLDQDVYEYLFKTLKGNKITDAISTAKAPKILRVLDNISILKMNKLEAESICGMELDSQIKFVSLLKMLNQKGVQEVLVTDKDGLYIGITGKVYHYRHDAYNRNVANVTGAGDCLLAAYSYSRFHNASIESAAVMGLVSAVLTVASPKSVAGIRKSDIREALANIGITGGIIYEYQN